MLRLSRILLLIILFSGFCAAEDEEVPFSELRQKAIEKFIDDKEKEIQDFKGNITVGKNDSIGSHVIVENGDLEVQGIISGDVIVIFGDATVKSGASINGNLSVINGRIYQAKDAEITGTQIETNVKNLFPPEAWENGLSDKFGEYIDRLHKNDFGSYSTLPLGFRSLSTILRYNRIEGPFIGLELPKMIGGKYTMFNAYGFGGYGFGQNKWQYKLGINKWFFSQTDNRLEIGGEIFDFNDTKDFWIITPFENSLSAFLIHEDFQDFYRVDGYKIYASLNFTIFLQFALAYNENRYESLENKVEWALFGGKKKFDKNPAVDEGSVKSITGNIYLDTRDNKDNPRSGWYALFSGETSNSGLNSDFSFNQYNMEIRRYQPLSRYERLDIRLMAGTAQGFLPFQKSYDLGGIGSIRGAGFKQIRSQRYNGNVIAGFDRMLLANVEYNINHRIFHSGLSLLNDLNYILIFDIGNAWHRDQYEQDDRWYKGFSHLQWPDMITSAGIGIVSWSGRVRLTLSRRLDSGKDPMRILLRLRKPF